MRTTSIERTKETSFHWRHIPIELWTRVKIYSAERNVTLSQLVSDAVKGHIKKG